MAKINLRRCLQADIQSQRRQCFLRPIFYLSLLPAQFLFFLENSCYFILTKYLFPFLIISPDFTSKLKSFTTSPETVTPPCSIFLLASPFDEQKPTSTKTSKIFLLLTATSFISSGVSFLEKVFTKFSSAFWAADSEWYMETISLANLIFASRGSPAKTFSNSFIDTLVQISKASGIKVSGQLITFPYISSGISSSVTMFPSLFPIFLPVGSTSSLVVKTNFSFPLFFIMSRPTSILNVWSLPPISTSTFIATESYP